jgi:hypothetical protein
VAAQVAPLVVLVLLLLIVVVQAVEELLGLEVKPVVQVVAVAVAVP